MGLLLIGVLVYWLYDSTWLWSSKDSINHGCKMKNPVKEIEQTVTVTAVPRVYPLYTSTWWI